MLSSTACFSPWKAQRFSVLSLLPQFRTASGWGVAEGPEPALPGSVGIPVHSLAQGDSLTGGWHAPRNHSPLG